MFFPDFLVGVLSLDEGLVRWDQLRRSDDSATIVATMVGGYRMWWLDSHDTYHTPGLACSVLSLSG